MRANRSRDLERLSAAVPELTGVEHGVEDGRGVATACLLVDTHRCLFLVGEAERVVVTSLAVLEVVGGEALLDEKRLAECNLGWRLWIVGRDRARVELSREADLLF